jgi:hypothetical protein
MATGQQPLPPPPQPPGPPGGGGPPGPPQGGPMPPPPPGAHPAPPQGHPTGAPIGKMIGNGQAPVVQKAGEVAHPNLPNIAGSKNKPTIPGVTDQGM